MELDVCHSALQDSTVFGSSVKLAVISLHRVTSGRVQILFVHDWLLAEIADNQM